MGFERSFDRSSEVTLRTVSLTNQTSLKYLTLKAVFLVALASGRRRSEIRAISLSSSVFSCRHVTLFFRPDFLAKNESNTFSHSTVVLPRIEKHSSVRADRAWCPVRALEYYVKRTASIRGSHDQLFITHSAPHNPASGASMARWICEVIANSHAMSADVPVRAHSVRNVATSWAYQHGVSIANICEAVSWKQESTFSSVYYRDVAYAQEKFAKAVLRKH